MTHFILYEILCPMIAGGSAGICTGIAFWSDMEQPKRFYTVLTLGVISLIFWGIIFLNLFP